MNRKDKLIESTLLALQGKLNLNESNKTKISSAKQKKTEDVEVKTDTAEVTVGEDTTIIDTDEATVTVEKNTNQCVDGDCVDTADDTEDTETFDDTPLSDDGENVEVPVEGNDTIVPDEDIPMDDMEDEEPIEESKEQAKKGEVPDEAYDVAEYIKSKIKGQKTISKDDFDALFDEAKEKFAKTLGDYENLEADVRGILSYSGYATDVDNGDLTTESKQRKTEDVDPRPNETKMLNMIDDGIVDTKELSKELLAWLSDDDIKRFMEVYEYTDDLDESKKCKKGKKTIKEAFDEDDLELDEDQMYAYLSDVLGVSEEALSLVTHIDGYSRETLNDILYAKTGYRSFKQYMEAEDPESYSEYFKDEDDDLDESKKLNLKKHKQIGEACKKNECDKNCDKTVKKFSSNTFNEALTNMYKSKYKTVESFKTTKVKLSKNSIKIEGKLINLDGIAKPIKLEMKKLNQTKSFAKYEMKNYKGLLRESKNSTLKMMTRVNKDNVLECKYVITK